MKLPHFYNIRNEVVVSGQDNTAKHCNNFSHQKSFKSRIKQISAVSLIFLSMITGEVFAGDKLPKSKVGAGRKKEATFEIISLSSSLPDVVSQFPLPDLITIKSASDFTSAPPMPDIVPPVVYLMWCQINPLTMGHRLSTYDATCCSIYA